MKGKVLAVATDAAVRVLTHTADLIVSSDHCLSKQAADLYAVCGPQRLPREDHHREHASARPL